MPDDDEEETELQAAEGKPLISFAAAMIAYAVLAVFCLATLHGDGLYIALLIIGALAMKTWLARVKSRLE